MWRIDQSEYPQGDIQTWDESTGDRVLRELWSDLHICDGVSRWERGIQDYSIRTGQSAPPDEDPSRYFVRDRLSGLPYRCTYPLEIDLQQLGPFEREVLYAAESRRWLGRELGRPLPEVDSGIDETTASLAAPVVDFEAGTRRQCEAILEEVESTLARDGRADRLWLRGQRREYFIEHADDVLDRLHFGRAGRTIPSLVPSLGRFARSNPGVVDTGFAWVGPSHQWKKPFIIWMIRQNPEWLDHLPAYRERVEASLRSDDASFAQILHAMPLDNSLPPEIEDLVQGFFHFVKFGAWAWVLQQYGYHASMLDVTQDLDAALFFSQAEAIEGRITLPDATDERVLYVLADYGGCSVFWDTERVDWGEESSARQLPERVVRQNAGCVVGSTWFRQNMYGHLVIARIKLTGGECVTRLDVRDVFPPPEEDLLLRTLLDAKPRPKGLYW